MFYSDFWHHFQFVTELVFPTQSIYIYRSQSFSFYKLGHTRILNLYYSFKCKQFNLFLKRVKCLELARDQSQLGFRPIV